MALTANADKMASKDRVLKLSVIDKKKPLSSTGMVDSRLFSGNNTLHAIKEEATNFWYMKFDAGILPEPLRHKFTTFSALKKHAEDYYKTRNVEIKEVIL